MELMQIELPKVSLPSPSTFKQDPVLAAAIDKLYKMNDVSENVKDVNGLVLPDRKLEFREVQRLLSETNNTQNNRAVTKTSKNLLTEINSTRKKLLKKVESILDSVNKAAEQGDTPKLVIRNQRLWSNCIFDLDRVTLKAFNDAKKTTVTYTKNEDKSRFNKIIFLLTKTHELLSKNLTVTRRELFYQNVTRFRNQSNLDIAVRDVCCLLEFPPWNLGIVSTAKGLIAGPLTMLTSDGKLIECMKAGGTLIPQDVVGLKELKSPAKYILVVEKDAIFQKLLDEGILIRLGPLIIMTGKGYPDVCTRQLLSRLCKELRLTALALVDADPHGYEIFLTYKYGSLAQSHLSSSLACSSLLLLGARSRDVNTLAPSEAKLRINSVDQRKLNSILKRPYLDTIVGSRIKEELNVMLTTGIKAEIEALAPTTAALCDAYLPSKIIQGDFLG